MRSTTGLLTVVVAAVSFAAGCGGDGEGAASGAEAPRGAALVAGSSLDRWGLLVVPREGGAPHLRSLVSPADSVWTGRIELPPSVEVHPLDGGVLVLRAADGTVRRYDPARERLVEAGRVDAGAAWSSSGGDGLFAEVGAASLLEVGPTGEWSYDAPAPVAWAAPRGEGGGAVVLTEDPEGEDRTLHVFERGDGGETAIRAPGGPPALITGWGRRLVLSGRSPGELLILGLPDLEERERVELEGAVRALAASPSSHEIYVGLDGPGKVVALNRFSGGFRDLAEVPAPAEVRPGPLGGPLLVHGGDGVWWVPLEGEPRRVSSEWRTDLPRTLPDGRVLAVREGRVVVLDPRSGADDREVEAEDVGPAADRWWLVFPWRPPRPDAVAGVATAGAARGRQPEPDAPGRTAEEGGGVEPPATEGGTPTGQGPGRTEGASGGTAETPAGEADAAPGPEVPAGFYAIVASSQTAGGIRDLAGTLSEGGFPTLIQRHRDEANEVWYRAMVGPFEAREDAEAAARQLRRERGLQVWISEIGPGTRAVRLGEGTDA